MNYDDLIEESDQNLLLTLRDQTTEAAFMAGDIALKYINKRHIYGITKAYAYSAVASFLGRQSRTIRDYAAVSEFYPKEVRAKYPILSFHHFRMAMRTEKPYDVLEWAIGSLDGRPQTVDACLAKFAILESEQESVESMFQPIRRYIMTLPGFIRDRVEHLLDQIEELIKEVAI